jgi:hypothetical protein
VLVKGAGMYMGTGGGEVQELLFAVGFGGCSLGSDTPNLSVHLPVNTVHLPPSLPLDKVVSGRARLRVS